MPDPAPATQRPIQVSAYGDFEVVDAISPRPAEATPETPAAPALPDIPPELIERAGKLGLTPEEAFAYKDKAELTRSLNIMERSMTTLVRHMQPTPPPVAQPAAQPTAPVSDPLESFVKVAKEAGWDQSFTDTMTALHASHREEIKAIKDQLGKVAAPVQQIAADHQRTQDQRDEATLNSLFAAENDSFAAILGREPKTQLHVTDPKYSERHKLCMAIGEIQQGKRALGQPIPPLEELYHQAKWMLFGPKALEQTSQNAGNKVVEQVRSRNGQFTAQPSSRETPMSDYERAVAEVRTKMANGQVQPGIGDDIDWAPKN